MEYETADGSHFLLQPILEDHDDSCKPTLLHTSVTAFVDGKAYAGKVQKPPDEVDEMEAMACLQLVPPEHIYPVFDPNSLQRAPPYNPQKHYLKAPSFAYEDGVPGNTFAAECVLNEAHILQRIRSDPHPSLPSYLGCIVDGDNRIIQLCLPRYQCNLMEYLEDLADRGALSQNLCKALYGQIRAGVEHLHERLGMAHNDLNEQNICIDENGNAVIIDFDGCLPFGQQLLKGLGGEHGQGGLGNSSRNNDHSALNGIADLLDAIANDSDTNNAEE